MAVVKKEKSEKDVEFAKGGTTPMFGHQNSGPQKAGVTEHDNGPAQSQGTDGKFAEGGKGKMFGYNPAKTATAGITSAY